MKRISLEGSKCFSKDKELEVVGQILAKTAKNKRKEKGTDSDMTLHDVMEVYKGVLKARGIDPKKDTTLYKRLLKTYKNEKGSWKSALKEMKVNRAKKARANKHFAKTLLFRHFYYWLFNIHQEKTYQNCLVNPIKKDATERTVLTNLSVWEQNTLDCKENILLEKQHNSNLQTAKLDKNERQSSLIKSELKPNGKATHYKRSSLSRDMEKRKEARENYGSFLIKKAQVQKMKMEMQKDIMKITLRELKEHCIRKKKKRNEKSAFIESCIKALEYYEKKIETKVIYGLLKYTGESKKCRIAFDSLLQKRAAELKTTCLSIWAQRYNYRIEKRKNLYSATQWWSNHLKKKTLQEWHVQNVKLIDVRARLVANTYSFSFLISLYEKYTLNIENANLHIQQRLAKYQAELKLAPSSPTYFWTSEGFNLQKEKMLRTTFKGIKKYTNEITAFKYKHVYNELKDIMKEWIKYTHKGKVLTINLSEAAKSRSRSIQLKVLSQLRKHMQASADSKKRKALVRMNLGARIAKNCLMIWKAQYKNITMHKKNKANSQINFSKLYKRKGLHAWIKFLNARYSKYEIYGKNLQIHYKKMMHRILKEWGLIKLKERKLQEVRIQINKKIPYNMNKHILGIWKREYLKNQAAQKKRNIALQKLLISMLSTKVKVKKLLIQKEIQYKKVTSDKLKKLSFKLLLSSSKKYKLARRKKEWIDSIVKKKALKKVVKLLIQRKNKKKNVKRSKNKALQYWIRKRKSLSMKILNGYAKTQQSRNKKLLLMKHFNKKRYFILFVGNISALKRLDIVRRNIMSKRESHQLWKCFVNWYGKFRANMQALFYADTKRNCVRAKHSLLCLKANAIKRKRCRRNSAILKEKEIILAKRKVLLGLLTQMHNPYRESKKTAIHFYLLHTYQRCFTKMKGYASTKRFYKSIEEYSKLRLKKLALGHLHHMTKWLSFVARCMSTVRTKKVKKLFSALSNYSLSRKETKERNFLATQRRDKTLKSQSLGGFKCKLRATLNKKKLISSFTIRRKAIVLKYAHMLWKTYSKEISYLKQSEVSFRSRTASKKVVSFLRKWQYITGIKEKKEYLAFQHLRSLAMNILKSWKLWNLQHKKKGTFRKATSKLHKTSILERSLLQWKQLVSKKKQSRKRVQTIGKRKRKCLLKKSLTLIKENSKLNQQEKGIMEAISYSQSQRVARNCFERIRFKYLTQLATKKFQLYTKAFHFQVFKGKLQSEISHKNRRLHNLQGALHLYTSSLLKKAFGTFKQQHARSSMHKQYNHVMHMFILKKYLQVWKQTYSLYAYPQEKNMTYTKKENIEEFDRPAHKMFISLSS